MMGGLGGVSMTAADTYRRYAAECVSMAQRRKNASDKAQLLQMATMWLKLAEIAEKKDIADEPSLAL
jgi:Holliday junction resolvasome RuvABC endonuclease subunit